jgi:hypothetical protein
MGGPPSVAREGGGRLRHPTLRERRAVALTLREAGLRSPGVSGRTRAGEKPRRSSSPGLEAPSVPRAHPSVRNRGSPNAFLQAPEADPWRAPRAFCLNAQPLCVRPPAWPAGANTIATRATMIPLSLRAPAGE